MAPSEADASSCTGAQVVSHEEVKFAGKTIKDGEPCGKVSGNPHQATARKEKKVAFFCRLLCESGSLFPVASLKRGQNLCWTPAENPQTP